MVFGGNESAATTPSTGSGQRPLGAQKECHRIAGERADAGTSRAEEQEGMRRALVEQGTQPRDGSIVATGLEQAYGSHAVSLVDRPPGDKRLSPGS